MKHLSNEILFQVKEVLELQSGLLRELSKLIEKLAVPGSELTEERLLPVRKAAERLGVAESTLRRLIAQGEIGARKVGGKVVVPLSEIQRIAKGEG